MPVLSVVPANRLNMNEIRSEIGSPATNLFDFKWSDHILNDIQWLRGDTFSWQSGLVYTTAYGHLVDDFDGTTSATETIGSYTITYYLAEDGHKIVLPDMEETVANIYNESGVAWYYILDVDNQRFKLPRTKWGFVGVRDVVGKYVEDGLPPIPESGAHRHPIAQAASDSGFGYPGAGNAGSGKIYTDTAGEHTHTGGVYGSSEAVQQRATQVYLYFYVGNFTQAAVEQTAGLNAELFNSKVDKTDLKEIPCVVEIYQNGTSWFRVWSDGWCEQGGMISWSDNPNALQVNLLKTYTNTDYNVLLTTQGTTQDQHANGVSTNTKYTSYFTIAAYTNDRSANWRACGYIEV